MGLRRHRAPLVLSIAWLGLMLAGAACNASTSGAPTRSSAATGELGAIDSFAEDSLPEDSFPQDSIPEDSFPADSGGDVGPSAIADYRSGSATLKLSDGTTVVLDQVGPGSQLLTLDGSRAVWTNAAGWYLGVFGAGAGEPGVASPDPADVIQATITLDRVVGSHHWVASGDEECESIVEKADATGLRGSGACQGLTWTDFILSGGDLFPDVSPIPVAGQKSFDVDITFDAH
jgi:hypothetical protein